jgi:hypothetical protein
MNTDLRKLFVEAEGRFLSETELARARSFALGARSRLEVSRRLQELEDELVRDVTERVYAADGPHENVTRDRRELLGRHVRVLLRYLAQAHVRDDASYFRRSYGGWAGRIAKTFVDQTQLTAAYRALLELLGERIDAADAVALGRYLAIASEGTNE